MITLYCARWVVPVSSTAFADGAIAINGEQIVSIGPLTALVAQFPQAIVRDFGDAAIIPGLINSHSHLELTAMRGFLENEETDFFAWLKKLTIARLQRMNADDLKVSAAWGACEAARAGVTCVADASDSALESMNALHEVGLRGIVFQESFGPNPQLAKENFEKLKTKIAQLRGRETSLVKCGVSPHAPYTVCAPQLELISRFAVDERLPLMMHAAETSMEVSLLRDGLQYLNDLGVLQTRPLLAHCIYVDELDLETLKETGSRVAHCPKSNAKLGHDRAPFAKFLDRGVSVGLGSDSVASNNTCDLLEEARFALLLARLGAEPNAVNGIDRYERVPREHHHLNANDVLKTATLGGARALGWQERIGELREGLQADFVVVALNSSQQIPSYDPVSTLIFASSGSDVRLTVVAGREVYCDGRITTVDEERLRARMKEIADNLQ